MTHSKHNKLDQRISDFLQKEECAVHLKAEVKSDLLQKLKEKKGNTKLHSLVWSKNPWVKLAVAACLSALMLRFSVSEPLDGKKLGLIEILADTTSVVEDSLDTRHDSIVGLKEPMAL